MRRIVLIFGLIAGAILAVMMIISMMFHEQIGMDRAEALGYTTMVLAFLMVFFGIRSYRDNVAGGTVRFGKAFGVGILITLIASACYVATWQAIYYGGFVPDFAERYAEHMLSKDRAAGATEEEILVKRAEMERFWELYQNPFVNMGMTFIEIFPVGLIVTLVSAGVLSRKRHPGGSGALAPAMDR